MGDDQKYLKIQAVIAVICLTVFATWIFYLRAEEKECLLKEPVFTNAEVTSISSLGRYKDISYTYFVANKKYVRGRPYTEKLKMNQTIKIVYCKNQPNNSMWYEDYIRMINEK